MVVYGGKKAIMLLFMMILHETDTLYFNSENDIFQRAAVDIFQVHGLGVDYCRSKQILGHDREGAQ